VPTINDSQLIRWNSDKRYLLELAEHGVASSPPSSPAHAELRDVLAAMPGQQVVIKPTISGGAWHTLRGIVGDQAFAQAGDSTAARTGLPGAAVRRGNRQRWRVVAAVFRRRVQPCRDQAPRRGDYRVQGEFGGSAEPILPSAATLAAADRALAAVAAIGHGNHAYVRVDGVICDGRFLIMELELIEPFLHLASHPQAAERLARHVAGTHRARNRLVPDDVYASAATS
jgi:hypothetical protein